jgi:hypothetical protein
MSTTQNLIAKSVSKLTSFVRYAPRPKPGSSYIGTIGDDMFFAPKKHSFRRNAPSNAAPSSSNSFIFVVLLLLLLGVIILVFLYLTGNLSSGFTSEHYNNIVNSELFSHQI